MTAASGASSRVDREIVITRTIDAPRHMVFRAFTEVRHLSRWWGPSGFTTTTHSFEFSEGGVWEFIMHGPDCSDYPNWITWRRILPPERLVLVHGESADDPDAFDQVISFADRGETTEIVMHTVFPTAELRDRAVRQYRAVEGGRQTLQRLAEYITEQHQEES